MFNFDLILLCMSFFAVYVHINISTTNFHYFFLITYTTFPSNFDRLNWVKDSQIIFANTLAYLKATRFLQHF